MRLPPGRRVVRDLRDAERGLWEFSDYLSYTNGQIVTVEGLGAGTGVNLLHHLGRIPEHFTVVSQDGDGNVWRDEDDDWSSSAVTFRATLNVTFRVRIW